MTERRDQDWLRGLRQVVNSRKNLTIILGSVLSIILHKFGLNSEIQFMYAVAILGSVGVQGYRDVKAPKAPDAD